MNHTSSLYEGMMAGGGKPMHPMPVFAEDDCVQAIHTASATLDRQVGGNRGNVKGGRD